MAYASSLRPPHRHTVAYASSLRPPHRHTVAYASSLRPPHRHTVAYASSLRPPHRHTVAYASSLRPPHRSVYLSWLLVVLWLVLPTQASAGKVIFVRVLVDEEEATNDAVWRARLSQRVEAASEIIGKYTDVSFVVKDSGRWQSDNTTQDLPKSLTEFEQEVPTNDVRLAIGFSSQYRFQAGRNHLGGTHGPLRHHILIRENARTVRESERLEVLVHELGHFLCAAHSRDPNSAMRPVVGDGKARAADFQIGFDQANADILRRVGQELRDRRITRFAELSPRTLTMLRNSYVRLNRELPNDLTAQKYLRAIDQVLAAQPKAPNPADILIRVPPEWLVPRPK